jgi:multiple sugar transport system substrate-binding protein
MSKFTRRKFLQASGAGLAGILASHQAPVFAQQTTVHWLKWNDFVPASDELLRKSMVGEASKALGIKLNLETINGNDLQPRITSAIQSGTGPDVIMLFNNHPHLYAASVADVSDVTDAIAKAQGGYYKLATNNTRDGKKALAVPWCVIGARRAAGVPQVVVRRGRLQQVPGDLGAVPRRRQEAEGEGPADRPDARPHVR